MPSSIPTLKPHIRLHGQVNQDMLNEFLRQQSEVTQEGPVVLELSTSGGDADIGRRIAQDLRQWQECDGREVWFLGKSYVFSAGVTIMAAIPSARRVLTQDCEILIHERKLDKSLKLDGALSACKMLVLNLLAEIESGQRLEKDGFSVLAQGSKLSLRDIQDKVMRQDWYLNARQAVEAELAAEVL